MSQSTPALPTLAPLATKRLYRQIADLLRSHIDSGAFAVGTALPPERELAAQLGVSRTSVREALIALEVEGRVSVKVGIGVTVLEAPPQQPSAPGTWAAGSPAALVFGPGSGGTASSDGDLPLWPDVGPLDVVEARLALEPEAAALAAANAVHADVEELRVAFAALAQETRASDHHWRADRRFHEGIARSSGNAALARLVAQLWAQRASPLFRKLDELFADQAMRDRSEAEHRLILEAIEQRDSELARLAMRTHLSRVRATYTRGID